MRSMEEAIGTRRNLYTPTIGKFFNAKFRKMPSKKYVQNF